MSVPSSTIEDKDVASCPYCQSICSRKNSIRKKCYCCNDVYFLHHKCASKFYTWTKGDDAFEETKFTKPQFKFYCSDCLREECNFCGKKHNIGEDKSFPVMCSQGHWLIASMKCSPKSFQGASKKKEWFCKEHSSLKSKVVNKASDEEVVNENLLSPEEILTILGVLPISENQDIHLPPYPKIKSWAILKKKKPLSYFRKLHSNKNVDMEKFHNSFLNMFKKRIDQLNNPSRRLTKKEKEERKDDKDFLDYLKDNFWGRKTMYETIISSKFELPYNISAYSLDILYSVGREGWLNDECIGIFYALLQEYVLIVNKDKDQKLPFIYLDSQCFFFLYPQEDQWDRLKIEQLFDVTWMTNEENLSHYAVLYKFWFEEKNTKLIGNILEVLNDKNEVS